jgi:importin subunit beta-1
LFQSSGDVDYINSLRVSVLEAYTGIILGLTDGGKGMLFIQFLDSLLGMLDIVANDPDTDSDVLDKAIGVIGDVAENIKAPAVGEKLRAKQATLQKLIQLGQDDEMCQDSASRALNVRLALHSD